MESLVGSHHLLLSLFLGVHDYTLYVMSDSYLGLDQQYDLSIKVEGEAVYYSD